ncbi:MAG: hypothetical protein GXP63_02590 [DPANN group archaeon]|nr:hypothetical protein [DPANN group archaeon]
MQDSFLHLKQEHGFTLDEILALFKDAELMMPASLFKEEGSPLSLVVHYLLEDCHLLLKDIPPLLHRSYHAVWGAARRIKGRRWIRLEETSYHVPMSCFSSGLSIMESIVVYLKERLGLTYHDIADALGRDDRTVWTYHHRALKKRRTS